MVFIVTATNMDPDELKVNEIPFNELGILK